MPISFKVFIAKGMGLEKSSVDGMWLFPKSRAIDLTPSGKGLIMAVAVNKKEPPLMKTVLLHELLDLFKS